MSIPKEIKIRKLPSPGFQPPSPHVRGKVEGLPTTPGVYLFKDKKGRVVYVGKATNLKSRVFSYWNGVASESSRRRSLSAATPRHTRTIDEMLHEVRRIEYQVTDSVIEALILEANLIRKYMPRYNVREKDDKSFLYVVVTRGKWPRVELVRGNELVNDVARDFMSRSGGTPSAPEQSSVRGRQGAALRDAKAPHYIQVFGPYTSASSIRAALDLIRKWFPWSMCKPPRTTSYVLRPRPCFDYHIGLCPGVCVGKITRREYMKNIRNVILFLDGKKMRVLRNVELEMKRVAKAERFEEAEKLRRKLFALRHIRDMAVLTKEPTYLRTHVPKHLSINILGRIEGYDISNISGTNAVGSMVVFEDGEPAKSEYRHFKIKTVSGINDVAMMREILERRFRRIKNYESGIKQEKKHDSLFIRHDSQIWKLPDLLVIDGGWGQVNVAQEVVGDFVTRSQAAGGLEAKIPIVGIAKGFKRKQDQPIFKKGNLELARVIQNNKDLLLRVRDEAHRFAVAYHRKLRGNRFYPHS